MNPMKRLTDKKTIRKRILQSLPIALAAIVVVIYGLSFLPRSAVRMERSVALVEGVTYYELRADGRPVAWFKRLGDSLTLDGLSLKADSSVMTRFYATGCWVDRYPFVPSCRGTLLVANGDSADAGRLSAAGGRLRTVLRREAARLASAAERLGRVTEEIDYYMRVHNVNDDGFNVMSAYSEEVKAARLRTDSLSAALARLGSAGRLDVVRRTKYAVLLGDTADGVRRVECNVLTADGRKPFRLLQTADRRTPEGASSLYLHQWLTPSPAAGDSLVVASVPGCTLYGFNPAEARAAVFAGTARGAMRHDVPPLLAPDGSPVFTGDGRLAGFSLRGSIVKPSFFGFGFERLFK